MPLEPPPGTLHGWAEAEPEDLEVLRPGAAGELTEVAIAEFEGQPREVKLQFRYSGEDATLLVDWGEGSESALIGPSEELQSLPLENEAGWQPGGHQLALKLNGEDAGEVSFTVDSPPRVELPGPAQLDSNLSAGLAAQSSQARASGMATDWRALAEMAVEEEQFSLAAEAYSREAEIYRQSGDINAALVEESKAALYRSELELYFHRPGTPPPDKVERARLEPESGCYLGAFIDRDENLEKLHFEGQTHGDVDRFNALMGRPHRSFFMYRRYGARFPAQWIAYLKERGAIAHIAWEPRSLEEVKDDAYLQEWVEQAIAADTPIILRFASEMNGEWTPYHGDPAAYKKAFQLVSKAFRRAPKVAMLWCPNTVPQASINDYYPGDEFVDWVGVNFYSVIYLDNDPERDARGMHPVDFLDFVYREYSGRKPIAIGEWAATQKSALDDSSSPGFAETKIAQLYGTLPVRYPRVKMVNWYDCNNLTQGPPGRRLNNYLLTGPDSVRKSYRRLTSSRYYLEAGQQRSEVKISLLKDKATVSDGEIQAWARTYVNNPQLFFKLDGKMVAGPHGRLSLEGLEPGKHSLKVFLFDDKDRFVMARSVEFSSR